MLLSYKQLFPTPCEHGFPASKTLAGKGPGLLSVRETQAEGAGVAPREGSLLPFPGTVFRRSEFWVFGQGAKD